METTLADQADGSEDEHLRGVDLDRFEQAGHPGVREIAADPEQHDGVDQGGEDLGPVVAERPPR